jgi:hypothetical protein
MMEVDPMIRKIRAIFKIRDVVWLVVVVLTLLFLAIKYLAQAPLASVGWNGLASVCWNG